MTLIIAWVPVVIVVAYIASVLMSGASHLPRPYPEENGDGEALTTPVVL
jgi:hypothetical protein